MLWQQPWVWVAGGVVLAGLEMLVPGFFLLGFALGAVLVGVMLWVGLLGSSLPALLMVFAVASVVAWVVLRRVVGVRKGQVKIWDRDINDN
jgi:membrane protein implicated in regulation of membrane protease activity